LGGYHISLATELGCLTVRVWEALARDIVCSTQYSLLHQFFVYKGVKINREPNVIPCYNDNLAKDFLCGNQYILYMEVLL